MKDDLIFARSLFSECFDTDEREALIILGFAKNHGKILLKSRGGEIANMICSCEIKDKDFSADYLFACCTKKELRGLGLFKSHLSETIGDRGALLIPESKSLFGFYERLGFLPITHLEVLTDSFDGFRDRDITKEKLFEFYKESCIFPKKDFSAFSAAIDAFLHYGGRIKEKDGVFITVIGGEIREIFAKSKDEVVSVLRSSPNGKTKLLLPFDYKDLLSANGIEFCENSIAMAKNVKPSMMKKIYLNNLFN